MTPPFLLVAADVVKTGGMDRANYALADYLARSGRELHIVAHRVAPSLLAAPGIQWHRVVRPLGRDALGWGALDRAGRRRALALAARAVRVLVNGGNCAVGDLNWVHYVHAAYGPPPAASPPGRAWQSWKRRRALRDERRCLAGARVVIANSDATRAALIDRLGLSPERVHRVYYGSDPILFQTVDANRRRAARAALGWHPGRRVAIFIGALGDRRKGFDTLFAAWQRLCADPRWSADLAVVGQGRELPRWRSRAQAAGLRQRIHFLGFRSDVPAVLAACDLLIAPTRYEAYGLAVHEAFACAIPALVSAQAGVAERLPPELRSLLLRDPDSVDELHARLLAWEGGGAALAPALLALAARLRAWTWDRMADQILALADS